MKHTNLSAYDSFDLHYNAIADYLAYHEIDIDNVRNHPRFGFGGTKITKGIEANRKARGNVFVRLDDGFTDKKGNAHPNITATLNGGAIKLPTFSCWEHFKALDQNATPVRFTPISEAEKAKRDAKAKQAAQQEQKRTDYLQRQFEQWVHEYSVAPTDKMIDQHADMVKHFGIYSPNVARFATGIKQLVDDRGDCLSIPLVHEIGGEIKAMQKIYGYNIAAPDKKPHNKDIRGIKKGAFIVFGNLKQAHNGLDFVEGITTALAVRAATGKTVVACIDTANIPIVVKKFSDWGYKNLIVCADNDIKPDKPNAGLIAAFKAVQDVPSASVSIPLLDGVKCDFADVFLAKGVEEVRRQLHQKAALQFECGMLYINKRIDKDSVLKADYEAKFSVFMAEVLKDDSKETNEKKKKWEEFRNSFLASCFAGYPVKYATPEDVFNHAANVLKPRDNEREALLNEIKTGCEIKREAVKSRNSLTKADLFGVRDFDRANPADMAILSELIKHNRATVIVDLPMGSNKTGDIAVVIETDLDGKSSIIIVPLSSLADNTASRLDTAHYLKTSASDLATAQKVTICINSILSKFRNKPSDEFQHVFIDEVTRVFQNILDGGTMKNPLEIYHEVIALILKSRLTWLADADLNGITLEFAKKSAPDKPIYRIIDTSERKFKLPRVVYRGGSLDTMRVEALEAVRAGNKIYIFCDSPSEVLKTKNFLKSHGIKDARILDIHGGVNKIGANKDDPQQKAFLSNPNIEALNYDVVIVSPVIQCGFSICNGHFDVVFGLISTGLITSNEIAQSLYRVRDAKEIRIAIKPQRNRNRPTSPQQLFDGEANTQNLISGMISEDCKTIELDDFSVFQIKAKIQRNEDLNDLENSILIHLTNIGFELVHDIPKEAVKDEKLKGLSEAVKAEQAAKIKAARSITSVEFEKLSANKQSLSSEESYIYGRHQAEEMIGANVHTDAELEKLNNQHDDVLTEQAVANYQSGMLSRIHNRELTLMDVEDIKQLDREADKKGKRHRRKTIVRKLHDDLMNAIERHAVDKVFANEKTGEIKANGRAFDKTIAAVICKEVLKKNAPDLSQNGYTDYSKPIERPVSTLRNIFNQYGVKLIALGRDSKEDESKHRSRWYTITLDAEITKHCAAREINRKNKPAVQ